MIPKVIHYCWFGGNPKPEIVQKCIASWRKYCSDWKIIEWNEKNYNINACPYIREAYEAQKYAFVSDVVRLDVINRFGGIYLDTDVELFCSFEPLIENDAFYVYETDRNINTGLGFGAVAGHCTVTAMLDFYSDQHFIVNGKPDLTPCPARNTEALRSEYPTFSRNGKSQRIGRTVILSYSDYSAFAKHHGAMSWVDGDTGTHVFKDTKLKRVLRAPRLFDWIETHFGKRFTQIYTFLVYDLLEMGPIYYFKRLVYKIKKR